MTPTDADRRAAEAVMSTSWEHLSQLVGIIAHFQQPAREAWATERAALLAKLEDQSRHLREKNERIEELEDLLSAATEEMNSVDDVVAVNVATPRT